MSCSTIRELSENAEWAWYKDYLHTARIIVLIFRMEYDKALENYFKSVQFLQKVLPDGHPFLKELSTLISEYIILFENIVFI